jgi:hypothetical protein
MNVALSGDQIVELLDNKVKIVPYNEISEYDTIDELLAPYGRAIILYMSKPNYGHWVLIHKLRGKKIEVCDSYGLVPDDELKFIPKEFRKASNQLRNHLSHLLADSKYQIHYNNHRLQSLEGGISTCGRWCVLRAINNDMNIDQFAKLVKKEAKEKNISLDQLVTQLINI